ncbi:hypothetical protein Moror_9384 [Moniliophthora roreri MCA 2997]|uniref:Uncharacterized protein n=1 Tax=Moniliophthora roreri (strain MCA 2997) TaxID=1381753 RepID=V2WGR8_MONRO|nr:hypothetical protein Moror_9384 [Moniliophthora roreri MCA 2997]
MFEQAMSTKLISRTTYWILYVSFAVFRIEKWAEARSRHATLLLRAAHTPISSVTLKRIYRDKPTLQGQLVSREESIIQCRLRRTWVSLSFPPI